MFLYNQHCREPKLKITTKYDREPMIDSPCTILIEGEISDINKQIIQATIKYQDAIMVRATELRSGRVGSSRKVPNYNGIIPI